jgi:hypothetical protein
MPSAVMGLACPLFLLTVEMCFRGLIQLPFSLECIKLPIGKSMKIFAAGFDGPTKDKYDLGAVMTFAGARSVKTFFSDL